MRKLIGTLLTWLLLVAIPLQGQAATAVLFCGAGHHGVLAQATALGVDHGGVVKKITNLIPDYMVMGERGMADMSEMEMPLPDNTVPMMTGQGPFGGVEMGGMFSVVKVRKHQKPGDYADPGWYQHPPGEVAFEWTGAMPDPARFKAQDGQSMPRINRPKQEVEVQIRKPLGTSDHNSH